MSAAALSTRFLELPFDYIPSHVHAQSRIHCYADDRLDRESASLVLLNENDLHTRITAFHRRMGSRTEERTDGLEDRRTVGQTDWRRDRLEDMRTGGRMDWRTDQLGERMDWRTNGLEDRRTGG